MAASKAYTVSLNVIGDTSRATKALDKTAQKGESVGQRLKGSFSGFLGVVNRTGVLGPFQEAFEGVGEKISEVITKGKTLGERMTGAGIGLAGLGVAGQLLGSKMKASQQQLSAAIQATGHDYADYKDKIEGAVKSQVKYGNTAPQVQRALTILTQATHDPAKALKLLQETTDLAAARFHGNLEPAAIAMGRTFNGNTRLLKQFGIQVVDTTKLQTAAGKATKEWGKAQNDFKQAQIALNELEDRQHAKKKLTIADQQALRHAQEKVYYSGLRLREATMFMNSANEKASKATKGHKDALTQLSGVLHGQANAAANTFTGRLKAIRAELANQIDELGQKYGPALTGAGAALSILGAGMSGAKAVFDHFRTAQEGATVATDAFTASEDAAAVSEGLALGPILLIIAAAALLGVGIYELATHWKTVWGAMHHAVAVVWNWIKHNWPLLTAILAGPIGLAVLFIARHWNAIRSGAGRVVGDVRHFFAGLPGEIGRIAADLASRFVGFISGLPGRLAGYAGNFLSAGANLGGKLLHGLVSGLSGAAGAIGRPSEESL
jgi:hypothetical protein